MSTQHHPSEDLVAAFAAGALDQGQHIVTATHLAHCASCRALAAAAENIGGDMLAGLAPAAMAPDSFARALSRLDEAPAPVRAPAMDGVTDVPGLPPFVRRISAGGWTWVAPGLHLRRLHLGAASATRVFLLRSRPGARFLRHTHTGFEMTCVLTGSFSHDGARYAAGDFDLGTPETEHDIEIGRDGPCISIVAMQGALKLGGLLGRMLQPLMRL